MKKVHFLKVLRVLLAILVFTPILLFFVDFTGKSPLWLHRLMHFQFIPSLLGGMYGIMAVLLLLTFLFGRIYCSVICPAGVLQDIINRIYCIGKKKKNGIWRFRYHKPQNWLRYTLLAVTGITIAFGSIELCLLLDPYSNFGRIAGNLFRPLVILGNNLIADGLAKTGNYSLYHESVRIATPALIAASVAIVVFIVFSVWRGRLFCNTLCPVGALLSLFSRFSLMRIAVDKSLCNHCLTCERSCKAEAINSKEAKIDMSRCVGCFNCLSSCKQNALTCRPFFVADKTESAATPESHKPNSRREFIATSAAIAVAAPAAMLKAQNEQADAEKRQPVTPPGSLSLEHFKDKCTACHLCVTHCPSHVLRPAGLAYGFDYLLKPQMSYVDSYCNYECVICSEVCPLGAIRPLTVEEKKTTQIGVAQFFEDICVVKVKEQDCGACSEHCPTQAVHMVPYKGTLTIPKVEPELCVGCGGCESICPVRPDRAIIIKAHPVHRTVEKIKEEKALDVEINEFGF
ncbi:MAG: 4Fe-4S binding protein [Tannerella sp.]|jgi:ferredoxin|nr:4Fe-4S binding protein [Tannerella sp.]